MRGRGGHHGLTVSFQHFSSEIIIGPSSVVLVLAHLKPISPTFLPFSASNVTFSPLSPGALLSLMLARSMGPSDLGSASSICCAKSSPVVSGVTFRRDVPAGERIRSS